MNNCKINIITLYHSILSTLRDWNLAKKGQSVSYEILQTAHRLEKGLTIHHPKKLWGWDKAKRLFQLIEQEENTFEAQVGVSVLFHYLESKRRSEYSEDRIKYQEYSVRYEKLLKNIDTEKGGIVSHKYSVITKEQRENLDIILRSRHSIRQFDNTPVSLDALDNAISQALTCPSACNRQPFHIYILSGTRKKEKIGESSYNADKWLYITADINAYSVTEFNDWIVSASIFAGYLSLTLHANGIASCIMRKDLVVNTEYNKAVRHICNIPKNEKIILEFAIGNYKDRFVAPVSERKRTVDVITVVE